MSNVLDISKEWQSAASMIEAHNAAIKEAIALIPQLGKAYGVPSQETAKNARLAQQLEAIENRRIVAAKRAEVALSRQSLQEEKISKQREVFAKKQEQEATKEVQRLQAAQTVQAKTQRQLLLVQKAYDELALKKTRYNNLTENEERRLLTLTSTLQKYRMQQDAINTTVGKYQQRVGAYAGQYDAVGASIGRLVGELPAAANGFQTFALAISNNIGPAVDSIKNLISQNKILKANGEETKNVVASIASSFLSFNTVLMVGVTIFTLYSKEIASALTQMSEAEKLQARINETLAEVSSGYNDSILEIQTLTSVIKDNTNTEENRIVAYNRLKEIIPELESMTMKQALATDYLTQITDLYIKASLKRAIADKLSQKIAEEQVNLDIKRAKLLTEQGIAENQTFYEKYIAGIDPNTFNARMKAQEDSSLKYIETLKKMYKENFLVAEQLENELKGLDKSGKARVKIKGGTEAHTKAIKENTEALKVQSEYLSEANLRKTISAFEGILSTTSRLSPSYELFNGALAKTKELYDLLYGSMKKTKEGQAEIVDGVSLTEEELNAEYFAWLNLKEATDDYVRSIASGKVEQGLNSIGLASLKMFTDFDKNGKSTFDKLIEGADTFKEKFAITFNAVADVAKDVYAMITASSNARFDEERARLEEQYKFQLQFANGNATAEAELANQLEAKKREIANREAKAKKQQAIFNILLNTAQGITAALASVPPNPILAGIIGAIGAAQLAFASSAKVPQYFKGRKGGKRELAWTDERGAELRVGKDGTIKDFGSNKGARLQMLDEGDSIYTAEESTRILSQMRTPKRETSGQTIIYKPVEMEKTEINIDRNGITGFIKRQASNAEIMNRHIQIKKYNV